MNQPPAPTPGELEILKVLWDFGPSSVRNVFEKLAHRKEVHYNTVQTLLRLMETKQLVRHHTEGRTFVYTPCYTRDDSTAGFLDRVFDGAASELVQSLLRTEQISSAELDQLEKMIADARRQKSSS